MEIRHGEPVLCAVTYGSEGLKHHSGMILSLTSVFTLRLFIYLSMNLFILPCYSSAAVWVDCWITQWFHYYGLGPAWLNRWNILLIWQQQLGASSAVTAHRTTVWFLAAWKQLRGFHSCSDGFCPVRHTTALVRFSSTNSCDHNWWN